MKRGFTLVELVVVIGFSLAFVGMVGLSALRTRARANVDSFRQTLLADIRSQQQRAMSGMTSSNLVVDGWGVHFESDRYFLFAGNTYVPESPANVVYSVPGGITLSVVLPQGNYIFARGSGDLIGYVSGQDLVVIQDQDSTAAIRLNPRGVMVPL